jgi:hypothetical protein
MPSLLEIRRFVYRRCGARGALSTHEIAWWLRRESELRDLHLAIDALELRARAWVTRTSAAIEA